MKIKKIMACLVAVGVLLGFAPNMRAVKWTYNDVVKLVREDEFFFDAAPQQDLIQKAETLSNFLPLLEACRGMDYGRLVEYLKAISEADYYYDLERPFNYRDWMAAQRKYLRGVSIALDIALDRYIYNHNYPFNQEAWLAVQMEICVLMDYSRNYEELLHNLKQLITVYRLNEMQ